MTFPNPANYYLPTPAQFEAEIVELDLEGLTYLNLSLALLLNDHDDEFQSPCLSCEADAWVDRLKVDELINLIRWIGERLAYLYHKESIDKP